eukprot:573561-Prymnesium_polylepis.2
MVRLRAYSDHANWRAGWGFGEREDLGAEGGGELVWCCGLFEPATSTTHVAGPMRSRGARAWA